MPCGGLAADHLDPLQERFEPHTAGQTSRVPPPAAPRPRAENVAPMIRCFSSRNVVRRFVRLLLGSRLTCGHRCDQIPSDLKPRQYPETNHTLTFRLSCWNVKDVCFDTFSSRRLSK